MLIQRYEPSSNSTNVGRLVEVLSSSFQGDLLEAITDFERRIMVYENQSGEAVSDALKIGCVVKGLEQSTLKEHLIAAAAKVTTWPTFIREVESIEIAKRTAAGPSAMQIDMLHGKCHKCGKIGHTAK